MEEKKPSYERIFDMPMQKVPGVKRGPRWFARIAEVVLAIGFKVLFRYRVDNREGFDKLADGRGVVVVANHTSFLDTICIYLAILPHHLPRFIGRDKLFVHGHGALGWILAHVGVIPIARDTADRTAIKRAAKLLKMNEIIVIFPEGTRRGKGDIEPEMHGGAALIARMGKAPLIPITVRNAEKVKQKGKMVRFPKITMEFGEPVEVSDFDFLPKEQRLEGCAWYVMRDCFALSRRVPREEVDMTELFPHAHDYADVFAEHPIHSKAGEDSAESGTDDDAVNAVTAESVGNVEGVASSEGVARAESLETAGTAETAAKVEGAAAGATVADAKDGAQDDVADAEHGKEGESVENDECAS